MLSESKSLIGYKLEGLDGVIGSVKEFYFDDYYWTIRYLVANTGSWLINRQVLISPYALVSVTKENQHIKLILTKKQIEDSPSLNTDKPVSRQFEESYFGFYGWPNYLSDQAILGTNSYNNQELIEIQSQTISRKTWDPHLRSIHDVIGHIVKSSDGEIGQVSDFILDEKTWSIRYLIIETGGWWVGKKILVAPQWIERISWSETTVFVNLSLESIKLAPEYTAISLLTHDYESGLHHHYDRKGYWIVDAVIREFTR